jgi:glyoxylase-like metal-dependent hydrolase (beta-lactamase superfamily II)
MVKRIRYSNTNTYLIKGRACDILFDTGWAGTFADFCRALKEAGGSIDRIGGILISHFHPDHMGIAQQIADHGPVILAADLQLPFLHSADAVFAKEGKYPFTAIDDTAVRAFPLTESRAVLSEFGIDGEILATPGHSDDSISLCLDDGTILVGDLNPLYELECHRGTEIEASWNKLLAKNPKRILYGHAKEAVLGAEGEDGVNMAGNGVSMTDNGPDGGGKSTQEVYRLVKSIMKYIDKGLPLEKIQKKTGAPAEFIEQVTRMYLTHQNVGVQGILDRIELRKLF